MIIKGKARGNGKQLGRYLVSPGENERINVVEVRGTVSSDVRGAVAEMDAVGLCTRTDKTLYHAAISTRPDERLTEEQRLRAVDRLEEELGFTGQPRVIVVHEKKGREHTHVVWSRTDIEHGRAIRIDHNYRKHEIVARALEREFGQARVQGAHIEREGRPRPARTPSQAELSQAKRTGILPQQVTQDVTAIWQRTGSGKALAAGLEESGYRLARGNRRDYVIIDQKGGIHSLSRRIEGARAKDVRERLADLEHANVPTIRQAQRLQQDQHAQQQAERKLAERPETKTEALLSRLVFSAQKSADLAAALDRNGITIARTTEQDIERIKAQKEFDALYGRENKMPIPAAGETVAVDKWGQLHRLNPAQANTAALENAAILEGKALPSAMEARDEKLSAQQERQAEKYAREEEAQSSFDINKERHYARDHDEKKSGDKISVAGVVGGLADFAVGFLASLGGSPKPTPAQQIERQRQAIAALRSIKKDIERNEPLSPSDLSHLTPDHLRQIRDRGDNYLRELIDNLDRGRGSQRDRER